MAYVYAQAASLAGKATVGTKQCVALVQEYAKAPASSLWKEGKVVKGETFLAVGTAIATFVNGKYGNLPTGNHAALYLSQDTQGIWVIDQWSKSGTIQKRMLRFKGKNPDGTYVDPSNNGDAFSVID
ncbi:MAG: BPSL0067 family protein [Isosphaeraceae bacterium]|nr:BPSL0067 family protein [Isosphaeraceae bacterium]